jgi:hypothetical protein
VPFWVGKVSSLNQKQTSSARVLLDTRASRTAGAETWPAGDSEPLRYRLARKVWKALTRDEGEVVRGGSTGPSKARGKSGNAGASVNRGLTERVLYDGDKGSTQIEAKCFGHILLTTLNNAAPVGATVRQQAEIFGETPCGLVATYGVLMVKPRTAGTREMRAAAATVNFMASFKEESTAWGRRGHKQRGMSSTFTPPKQTISNPA